MIYRIEFNNALDGCAIITRGPIRENRSATEICKTLSEIYCEKMEALGLRVPKKVHPRARFWFTEYGWNEVGRSLAKDLMKTGAVVRVKRRKNPKASDVYWSDPYQLQLLPTRKK